MTWVVVGVFGALGALTRYGVSGIAQLLWRTTFPVGTLVVNLTGALRSRPVARPRDRSGCARPAGGCRRCRVPRRLLDVLNMDGRDRFSPPNPAAESVSVGQQRTWSVPLVAGIAAVAIGFAIGQWL